jgi:hypothetical protein
MIEFSDTLDKVYNDKEALIRKIKCRLRHTTKDIPYWERGVDVFEFTYGGADTAIRFGLRDFGANVTVDTENSRVQVYNVSIDYDDESLSEQEE